jgi:dTDP-glucose pyrophosphorylase
MLKKASHDIKTKGGATVFVIMSTIRERYGVVEFDAHGKVLVHRGKPKSPNPSMPLQDFIL